VSLNRARLLLLTSLLASSWSASAAAQTAPPAAPSLEAGAPESAQKRYLIGRELYQLGRIDEAANEFRAAYELFPNSPKLAYNLGRTYERLGKLEDAERFFTLYVQLLPSAPDRAEVEKILLTLKARREQRRAELVLSTTPPGASVFLDEGKTALPERTPTRLKVSPGGHVLRFHLEGYREGTLAVDVPERGSQAHHLTLQSHEKPDLAAGPPPRDWRPIAGWSLVGVGAAALGVGAYFLVDAASAASEAGNLRATSDGLIRYDELQTQHDRSRLTGIVSTAVGAGLAGAGAGLVVWSRLRPRTTPTVTPVPGGVVGSWQF
jgi:tetratricopeptide (TPR) repeat protein